MTTSTKFLTLLIILVCCYACNKDPYEFPAANDALLFPNSLNFSITQSFNQEGALFFEPEETEAKLVFIGIFTSPPVVVDDQLTNEEALIWQWLDEPTPGEAVFVSDGEIMGNGPELSIEYFQCNDTPLYWAAWGWDATAQYITHSTSKDLELSTPVKQPRIELLNVAKVGATPSDTLLVPGAEISLRLTFTNDGSAAGKDIKVNITQPAIESFPLDLSLPNLEANTQTSQTITFRIPPSFSFGDTVKLQLLTTYSDCFESSSTVELIVNALSVCLLDVRLIDIRYVPAGVFWDPAALPIFWDPDVYYYLLGPDEVQLHRSITLQDVSDDWPNTPVMGDWPDLTPCIDLKIDSTYSINFWDEDAIDSDDFIGTTSFRPLDYLETRDTLVTITNDEVMTELHLRWE